MELLGKGVIFPIELQNGAPIIRSYPELIRSSILMILSWPYRDRFFLAEYGARLEELLEEPNDEVLISLVQYFIFESISKWEPRVIFRNSTIVSNGAEKIEVNLQYVIKASKTTESFIYPFYKYRLT